MPELALPLADPTRRARAGFASIGSDHGRAASVLLMIVLGYGLSMLLASRVPVVLVAKVIAAYLPLTAATAALIAAFYAVILAAAPRSRTNLQSAFFWLVIAAAMVCLTFPFFGMFKQTVLPSRGFVWDARFAHLGRLLLGVTPWTLTHRVFGNLAGTRFLDNLYSIWMPIVFATPMVAAIGCRSSVHRFRIIASWFLAWVLIGSLAAWIFASAGPCYYNTFVGPDPSYAELQRRLAELGRQAAAQGSPIAALEFQPILLHAYRSGGFGLGGGISAMPSMHVAMATLLAIIAWNRNAAWGLFATTYALLIWVGSVHFGWHYVVDGPVAALMMAGVWSGTTVLARRLYPEKRSVSSASDPALRGTPLIEIAGLSLRGLDLAGVGVERTGRLADPLAPQQDQRRHQRRA